MYMRVSFKYLHVSLKAEDKATKIQIVFVILRNIKEIEKDIQARIIFIQKILAW